MYYVAMTNTHFVIVLHVLWRSVVVAVSQRIRELLPKYRIFITLLTWTDFCDACDVGRLKRSVGRLFLGLRQHTRTVDFYAAATIRSYDYNLR